MVGEHLHPGTNACMHAQMDGQPKYMNASGTIYLMDKAF